jgi:hypothetical protein
MNPPRNCFDVPSAENRVAQWMGSCVDMSLEDSGIEEKRPAALPEDDGIPVELKN